MQSLTVFLSLLTAVSATNLIPAIPIAIPRGGGALEALTKRGNVACKGGDVYCPEGYKCMTGSNGVPGCCPNGETCTGEGEIQTVVATNTMQIDYTSYSTYVFVTTGIYTGGSDPEPTSTEEEESSTTSTSTSSSSEEEDPQITDAPEDETEDDEEETGEEEEEDDGAAFTDIYPTTTTGVHEEHSGNATVTGKHNGTSQTGAPEQSTGGAAGSVEFGPVGWVLGVVVGAVGLVIVV